MITFPFDRSSVTSCSGRFILPSLVYDQTDVEDIDTDGEDHIYDMCRYVCMKNPIGPRDTYRTVERPYSPLETEDEYKPSRYAFYQVY